MRIKSTNLNSKNVSHLEQRIDENSDLIQVVVDSLVQQYCSDLDEYVDKCRKIVTDSEYPPTTLELDEMVLTLPTLMYYASAAQENLGIKEDVAEAIQQEAFNHTYAITDGTVKDRTAAANLASANETLVAVAYSRAYKKIKQRLDYSMEILQSIKKVMSRRMVELELSRVDPGRMKDV